MLKRLTPREQFEALIATYEPILRAAFIAAVDDIRSNIVLRRIVERLEKGDISGAIDAMFIEEAAFNPLEEALRQAFNAGSRHGFDHAGTERPGRPYCGHSLGCSERGC